MHRCPHLEKSALATLVCDGQHTVEFTIPLSNDEDRANAYHNDKPLGYRTMDNILSNQEGVDFEDAITHVKRMEFISVLTLAAQEGWRLAASNTWMSSMPSSTTT